MGSGRVVVPYPLVQDHLSLPYAVEDFTIKQIIPQGSVEALTVTVLPRATWFDIGRLDPNRL
jgi:hypothetical protein